MYVFSSPLLAHADAATCDFTGLLATLFSLYRGCHIVDLSFHAVHEQSQREGVEYLNVGVHPKIILTLQ